jgi:hypothetical protein
MFRAKAQRGKESSQRVEGLFILKAFFASSLRLCAFAGNVFSFSFKLTYYANL